MEVDYGCEYCRDDQNRWYGHVTQIGSSEDRGTILLRCPLCHALYEDSPSEADPTRRLTEREAEVLFPPETRQRSRIGDVEAWFAEIGYGLLIDHADGLYWAALTRGSGVMAPRYGRGSEPEEAAESARSRYRVEQLGISEDEDQQA